MENNFVYYLPLTHHMLCCYGEAMVTQSALMTDNI